MMMCPKRVPSFKLRVWTLPGPLVFHQYGCVYVYLNWLIVKKSLDRSGIGMVFPPMTSFMDI